MVDISINWFSLVIRLQKSFNWFDNSPADSTEKGSTDFVLPFFICCKASGQYYCIV